MRPRLDPEPGARARRPGLIFLALLGWSLAAPCADAQTVEYYIQQADAWMKLGRADNALANLDAAIQSYPTAQKPYLLRGAIRLASRQLDQAADDLSRAIDLDPSDAMAYNERAKARSRQGRSDEALADLDRAIELAPTLGEAYSQRASLRFHEGAFGLAFRDIEQAIRLEPGSADHHAFRGVLHKLQGRYAAARADFDRALELNPADRVARSNRSRLLSSCPDAAFRDGRLAFEDASQAFQAGGGEPGDLSVLVAAYAECGDFTKAIEYQEKALTALPLGSPMRPQYEECLNHLREREPCRDPLVVGSPPPPSADVNRPAAGGPPADPAARDAIRSTLNRAQILMREGKPEEAGRVLETGIDRYPDDLELRGHLALAYFEQNRPDLAEPVFREIIKRGPKNAAAHCGLAVAIQAQRPNSPERIDEMIAAQKEALRVDPTFELAYRYVLSIFETAGRPDEGLKLLGQAARREDAPSVAHYFLGEALFARGAKGGDVVAAYRTAIDMGLRDEDAARAHARIGQIHEAGDRVAEALVEYRSAIKRCRPDSDQARAMRQAIGRLESRAAQGGDAADAPTGERPD